MQSGLRPRHLFVVDATVPSIPLGETASALLRQLRPFLQSEAIDIEAKPLDPSDVIVGAGIFDAAVRAPDAEHAVHGGYCCRWHRWWRWRRMMHHRTQTKLIGQAPPRVDRAHCRFDRAPRIRAARERRLKPSSGAIGAVREESQFGRCRCRLAVLA